VVSSRGLRVDRPGGPPRLTTVELPGPRSREVLLHVTAAGVCRSDLHVVDAPPAPLAAAMPFTLGHEVTGVVAAVGDDVETVSVGEAVAVYGPWGCGECGRCRSGSENYCLNRTQLGFVGLGLGRDGGMADAVLVPHERHLVPLRGLDPVQAAPLTDAGLTSLHAVGLVAPRLPAAPVVAVLGVGGLGHLAVQVLRALVPDVLVVAVDVDDAALELATACGAQRTVRSEAGTAGVIAASGGGGADAVLDMVGGPRTIPLALGVLRPGGDVAVVGSGGGGLDVRKGAGLPAGARVAFPFWGSRPELAQVLDLARAGALRVAVETFPLEDAAEALRRLRAGTIRGRAVLVPHDHPTPRDPGDVAGEASGAAQGDRAWP
jgi:propanol-preferring alcohol dehydrogenase